MITLLVGIEVKADRTADFESIFGKVASIVRATEPGTHEYRIVRSRTDSNAYRVIERYKSQEAADAHRHNPETKALITQLGETLAKKPTLETLDEIASA